MSDERSFASPAIADRIARCVGAMAGRLADLLATAVPGEPTLESGQSFLRAMAASAHEAADPVESASHPLDALIAGLGWSPLEVDLLVLAGMPDEHEGYGSVLRALHPRQEPRPTVGLAAQLLCRTPDDRRRLRDTLTVGPAVRSGALTLTGEPFFERSLGCAEALWPVLNGLDVWPTGLEPLRESTDPGGLGAWLERPEVARAAAALRSDEGRLVLLTADLPTVAIHRAAALVASAGRTASCLAWPATNVLDAERLLVLHAVARRVLPVLRLASVEGAAPPEVPALRGFPGPFVACVRSSAVVAPERPVLSLAVEPLSPTERRAVWTEAFGEMAGAAATLAARYTLEPHAAAAVAQDVRSVARLHDGGAMELDDVAASVRTRANLALSSGVKLVRSAVRWDDLVLPADHMLQLKEAAGRLEHQPRVLDEWNFLRGRAGARGVRMLFAGPSGTGKTLAAQVMARELGVDLLVVDLARVVSKWIGETEKNLAEVFDAAERAQVVLLFDEADALFGKRTEISDAHDRYANLETAYLLSRLERFEGLAILSTNLRANIDPAFVRRLEFAIDFQEPSRLEREKLWRGHLPEKALAGDVDIARLAALYPVVGGLIRNAAVAAGFLAAADGPQALIANHHLTLAIRREYAKAGRALPRSAAQAEH